MIEWLDDVWSRGRLPIPAEALRGERVLVRQLLAGLTLPDFAAAAVGTRTAIGPTLRQLFPPPAASDTALWTTN